MGAIRLVIVLVVAAAAAIVLALVVRHMTASRPAVAMAATLPARPSVHVLVAKHDMKVGDRLAPEDVAWQSWPADAVNPAFVTGGPVDPKANIASKAEAALQAATMGDPAVQALSGSLVREAVLTNEPISRRKLVKGGEGGFMAVKLPQGMMALSLPVTVETGAGGFVLPGDHVDVVLNVKMSGNSDMHGGPAQPVQSRTVMRNLTVLAIDQTTEPKAGASSLVGATATLEVPAEDVDELAKSKDEGTLLLALRSYADMGGPAGRAAPPPVPTHPVRMRATPVREVSVRIYRGEKLTEVLAP
jgi:pilus assembly protein CpaB